MAYVMVDIETDGPVPVEYSMLSIGAVVVEPELNRKFYIELAPISDKYMDDALKVNGFTREQTKDFIKPDIAMTLFDGWLYDYLRDEKRLIFVADTAGFDWQFVNYYFWKYIGYNPFGHSSISLGSLWKGCDRNMYSNFKHLRKTAHTHNALDDAIGNAEAMLEMMKVFGIKH